MLKGHLTASGSHTGQCKSGVAAAPSHTGYINEEKVFCSVNAASKKAFESSFYPACWLSAPLKQIFRSIFPARPLPSPALQMVSLWRFFLDGILSKREAWEHWRQKVFITPEVPENTSLILGVLLINNRRKSFQVLYIVQKNEEWIKMQSRFKCYIENKYLRKK